MKRKEKHSFLNIQLISGLLSNLAETSDDTPSIFLGQPPTTQDTHALSSSVKKVWHP